MSIVNNLQVKTDLIPLDKYKFILNNMPVPCVDVVIFNEKKEILLLKRDNEPAKGVWWVPGGRILKNETIADAAIRKVREELGVNSKFIHLLGCSDTIFDVGPFEDVTTHTVNVYGIVELESFDFKLDDLHEDLKFSSNIDDFTHEYLKKIYKEAYEYINKK